MLSCSSSPLFFPHAGQVFIAQKDFDLNKADSVVAFLREMYNLVEMLGGLAGDLEAYSTSLPHILGLLGSRLSPFRLYVSIVNNPSLAPQPNEESYLHILLGVCASGIVRGPLGRISHLSIAILTLS